jgi:uncharacterized metal-binding protein YceD (DUF177 family)
MPLLVNLHELEAEDLVLRGEIPVEELDLDDRDPLVRARQPLRYAFEIQKLGESLLLTGTLEMELDCECVRCLKPLPQTVRLTGVLMSLPLEGEEAVPVVADEVDLTPPLREHILLAFPSHPVCQPECGGLSFGAKSREPACDWTTPSSDSGSPWGQLDNLKL